MKKGVVFTLVFALLANSMITRAFAKSEQLAWFIKRNGRETPVFSNASAIVDKYNGYYIDKTAAKNKDKVLYLTFDAGYENGNIEQTLDVLKDEDVPAAFFILDNLILKNENLVKRMVDEGHLICNHTKNHRNLSSCSAEEIEKNLNDLEKIYEERIGRTLDKYFRFPEGKFSEKALKTVSSMGYRTIFWSFAYDDWDNARQPEPQKAIKKIISNTHDGAIILLHPTSKTNADILPELISTWRSMGYRFGTLTDLTKKS